MSQKISITPDVVELLTKANSNSSYTGERYYFKGDLCQLAIAKNVATLLGIEIETNNVYPFVKSQEDFDRVKDYLIANKIDGWWHYVSHEEYCRIQGQYIFGGKYLRYEKQIKQIADKLGISVYYKKSSSVYYVTSEEEFKRIVGELNI